MDTVKPSDSPEAPVGQIWVCGACGKTSKNRYGDDHSPWDESCMLNSALCYEEQEMRDGELTWVAVPADVE